MQCSTVQWEAICERIPLCYDLPNTASLFADPPNLLANTNPPTTILLDLTSTTDRQDIAVVFQDIVYIIELKVGGNHEKPFRTLKLER